jgi:chromosome segregation ATPase
MSIAVEIRQEAAAKEAASLQRGAEQYRALVKATAGGKKPAFEQIEKVAAGAGKPVSEFLADVQRCEDRLQAIARCAKVPELQARLSEVQAALDRHRQTAADFMEKHDALVGPLLEEREALADQVRECSRLRDSIAASADPEIVAEMYASSDALRAAGQAVRDARQAIDVARGNRCAEQLADPKNVERANFDRTRHEQLVAAARTAVEQLPALERAAADAESKYSAARQKLLE